ncbi:hypothetical protein PAPYR_2953 [Paratrimastix pyriformis]|uniref:Uncharacterized protein n=1 Tax=Paratrimastix pyriformis TaxID=342808 RepID=A0ABQ8UNH4_9EUKA|nr:hypothetical protein PAPYR_2953 [Paratrimastix pyriformis]
MMQKRAHFETEPTQLEALPIELQLHLIQQGTDSWPSIRIFCVLISLSRAIRKNVQSMIESLSFTHCSIDEDETIVPSCDTIAALVGPCLNLKELVFPKLLCRCGRAGSFGWVTEALENHTRLRAVTIPVEGDALSEAALCAILEHLPDLRELRIGSMSCYPLLGQRVIATLGRLCPRLERLSLAMTLAGPDEDPDYGPLRGCPALRDIDVAPLGNLAAVLPALGHLETVRRADATVALAGPALVERLYLCGDEEAGTLGPGPAVAFPALAALQVSGLSWPLARGLVARLGATLQTVDLAPVPQVGADEVVAALAQCPLVRHVFLRSVGWTRLPDLSPLLALVEEFFCILTAPLPVAVPGGVAAFRGPRLASLCLESVSGLVASEMLFECPRATEICMGPMVPPASGPPAVVLTLANTPLLEELYGITTTTRLAVRCPLPRLRLLTTRAGDSSSPAPEWGRGLAWLEALPLGQLADLTLTLTDQPLLARCLGLPGLRRLVARLQLPDAPIQGLVLRPGAALRSLELDVGCPLGPVDLRAEGLTRFRMTRFGVDPALQPSSLILSCPALGTLELPNSTMSTGAPRVLAERPLGRLHTLVGPPEVMAAMVEQDPARLGRLHTLNLELLGDEGPLDWAALRRLCAHPSLVRLGLNGGAGLVGATLELASGSLREVRLSWAPLEALDLTQCPALEALWVLECASLADLRLPPPAGCPWLVRVSIEGPSCIPADRLAALAAQYPGLALRWEEPTDQ